MGKTVDMGGRLSTKMWEIIEEKSQPDAIRFPRFLALCFEFELGPKYIQVDLSEAKLPVVGAKPFLNFISDNEPRLTDSMLKIFNPSELDSEEPPSDQASAPLKRRKDIYSISSSTLKPFSLSSEEIVLEPPSAPTYSFTTISTSPSQTSSGMLIKAPSFKTSEPQKKHARSKIIMRKSPHASMPLLTPIHEEQVGGLEMSTLVTVAAFSQ